MSLWELAACVAGFNRANDVSGARGKAKPPTPEQHYENLRRLAAHGAHGS